MTALPRCVDAPNRMAPEPKKIWRLLKIPSLTPRDGSGKSLSLFQPSIIHMAMPTKIAVPRSAIHSSTVKGLKGDHSSEPNESSKLTLPCVRTTAMNSSL